MNTTPGPAGVPVPQPTQPAGTPTPDIPPAPVPPPATAGVASAAGVNPPAGPGTAPIPQTVQPAGEPSNNIPPAQVPPAAGSSLDVVRRIGYGIAAVAAILVFFLGAPEAPSGHLDAVAAIQLNDSANNTRAEGAPQQQVVNGWTTIEYLGHLSDQVDELPATLNDSRPSALLLIGVLTMAFHLGTAPRGARREP